LPIAYYDEKRGFGLLNKRLQVLIAWLIPQRKNLDMDPKKIYLWRQFKILQSFGKHSAQP